MNLENRVSSLYTLIPRQERTPVIELERREEVLLIPAFDVLSISGPAGTGKSSVADLLKRRLLKVESIKIGHDIRERILSETGHVLPLDFSTEDEVDIEIDEWQRKRMEDSRWMNPIVIEGRFSGVIGADVLDNGRGRNLPRITRVLFTFSGQDQEEKYRRIQKRENKKRLEKGLPPLSLEQVALESEKRDQELVEKGQRLYPNLLHGKHPYDPEITTMTGKEVYDIVIDTREKTQEDVYQELVVRLIRSHGLAHTSRKDFGVDEAGEIAFRKVAGGQECEALTYGTNCGRYSTRTIDIYHGENLIAELPVCSRHHAKSIQYRALGRNHDLRFGKNGIPKL